MGNAVSNKLGSPTSYINNPSQDSIIPGINEAPYVSKNNGALSSHPNGLKFATPTLKIAQTGWLQNVDNREAGTVYFNQKDGYQVSLFHVILALISKKPFKSIGINEQNQVLQDLKDKGLIRLLSTVYTFDGHLDAVVAFDAKLLNKYYKSNIQFGIFSQPNNYYTTFNRPPEKLTNEFLESLTYRGLGGKKTSRIYNLTQPQDSGAILGDKNGTAYFLAMGRILKKDKSGDISVFVPIGEGEKYLLLYNVKTRAFTKQY